MLASQLIKELQRIVATHGDLPIAGGYLTDDSGLREITLVDKNNCDAYQEGTQPVSIFLTQ